MGTQRKRIRLLALVLALILITSCFTACGNGGAAENQSIAKLPAEEQKTYYTSHEITEIERPKTYYVDGVDVLTLARGENWVQVCDTIKVKVNMSDGGNDFEVKKRFTNTGYSYEKKETKFG